jgi:H+/Cl- antiporter ClcA
VNEGTVANEQTVSDSIRQLAVGSVLGVVTALFLLVFEGAAHRFESVVWEHLPDAFGIAVDASWWRLVVLGVGGLVVGLVLAVVPGRGGHDPATEGLFGPPMSPRVVPGLLLAALLSLGIGVSLGPEAPLMGATGAVLTWFAVRRGADPQGFVALGTAGLLGAMFGAPVGAAFAFLELVPLTGRALYQRLVPLLASASAGALTITLIVGRPRFAVPFPAPRDFIAADIVSAAVIGALGAVLGLGAGVALRLLHPVAQRVPVVARVGLGGLALGGLAVAAGDVILFSGQREVGRFIVESADMTDGRIALVTFAKLASLVIAVAVGFRGGRVFPALFVGVALGALVHALVPGVPLVLAAGAATVGVLVAFIRLWLLSLLTVAMIVGFEVVPLLGVALIAAHLVVDGRREIRA